jgi:DNA mismatch repair protein MutS2
MELSAKTRRDLGWDALVEELASRARTSRGAALARSVAPLADVDAARARHEEVTEARALRDTGEGLPLDGVRDVDEALGRAAKGGALDPQLLRDVASTLTTGARVREHLIDRAPRAPRLLGRATLIAELDEVSGPIDDAFEAGREARLSDRASPALGGLRRKAQKVREELERRVGTLLDAGHVAPHLQDRFATQRDDRYVIPIRVDARARVRGIVHGTSQSGQTVFVEPEEIVELNNALKLAELEVAEEERRILVELSRLVEEALPRLRVNLEVLAMLDLVDACARLSADLRATAPELVDTGAIDLRRARHPLMVLSLARAENPGRTVVPNDVLLGFGQTLVISGPNAGGKTVALKTTGLCAIMARAGLHLPSQEGSKMPWFEAVLTDVGDDQSLERNLSTFSAHVLNLKQFLDTARPGVLVLLDEVAVGTDPEQGAALAQSVMEELAARGATAIVTTHYDRLKALAARDRRFENASVGFDVEKLQPTYQLHLGVPGASGAIVVARRLGLDDTVCARAGGLLGKAQLGMEELLMQVEAERKRVAGEREKAEREREEAERARAEAEAKEQRARESLEKARKGAHDDAVDTLRRAREELDRTRAVLRRSAEGKVTSAEVTQMRQTIDAAAQKVRESAPKAAPPPGRPVEERELKPGLEVWVASLGGRARVIAPAKSGKVQVQAGLLKLMVPFGEVRIEEGRAAPPPSARSRRGHNAFDAQPEMPKSESARGRYPSVDVRGERVDAAIGIAEKFLDDAMRAGQDGVLVIHGHGTGALRDRLREHLRDFPGVAEVRPGVPDEGGDGVTVVMLG